MEETTRGRGRPKGSSSFSNVRMSDLASRFPADAIIPISYVFLKNMGFTIEAPTLSELPTAPQSSETKEETKISFTIHNSEEE